MNSSRLSLILLLPLFFIMIFYSFCNRVKEQKQQEFLNLSDTVKYVGMHTCRSCHADIYETYIRTGMGQSFHVADTTKSAANFEGAIVYDSINKFFYKPFWKNDSLFFHEFRLHENDTVHSRIEKVDYIVGSGQHTNSHICNFNGFLYQAPITFYTQSQRWDLAPGFEGGFNSRFSRIIGNECMTCHNALPEFAEGSLNKFHSVPMGIDCERCHGPGEAHVREKLAGIIIDTSKEIDHTIVNPRHLSREKQMNVCQRCHLQGLALLSEGKTFFDFKPGMNLSDVMNIFLPASEQSRNEFIMASQAQRLTMSACFKASDMTCISCHNPHVSVKETSANIFNNKCISCHTSEKVAECSEDMQIRLSKNDNCFSCHMLKSGSIDIPHIYITDHFIRKFPDITDEEIEKVSDYLTLKCYTQSNPSSLTMAEAYLSFYERFSPRESLLDSARAYLFEDEKQKNPELVVQYFFLKNDYNSLLAAARDLSKNKIKNAWTFYRIGEAHYSSQNFKTALEYFSEAVKIQPLNLDFLNKQGAAFLQLNRADEAKNIYMKILQQQPKFETAWANLGFIYLREKNFSAADNALQHALSLNPDHEQAIVNLAILKFSEQEITEAKKFATRALKVNPKNQQARLMLERIDERNF